MPNMQVINEYMPTEWFDGTAPAINAANLNHIELGIKSATDEIIRVADIVDNPTAIDADTLDGRDSTEFMWTEDDYISDNLNNYTQPGSWLCANTAPNAPVNLVGDLLVFGGRAKIITQIYTTTTPTMYIRTYIIGTGWTNWTQLGVMSYSNGILDITL